LEEYDLAIQELKRADHSIFATLKYTRSCDVVISVIERLNKTYSYGIDAVLLHLKETDHLKEEIPMSSKAKENLFRQLFPDMKEHMERYRLFRKIIQIQEFSCEEEFRKNLTLVAHVEGREVRLTVEEIETHYREIKHFMKVVKAIILEEEIPVMYN